jgi:hypothetical protein
MRFGKVLEDVAGTIIGITAVLSLLVTAIEIIWCKIRRILR